MRLVQSGAERLDRSSGGVRSRLRGRIISERRDRRGE